MALSLRADTTPKVILHDSHTDIACGTARVFLDAGAERCRTLTGARLWWGVARGAIAAGIAAGAAVGLLSSLRWSPALSLGAGLGAALLWSAGYGLVVTPLRLAHDFQVKEPLAARYDCRIRYGGDAVQRRELRIVAPPVDLGRRIVAALRELSPSTRVRQLDTRRFEAVRPRWRLWSLGLRIEVHLDEKTDGSVAAAVCCRPCGQRMPFAADPAVYPDGGRSIENIEEFQLALRRLVERR